MRAYADSSFIARLILVERESPAAAALYRRAGRPSLTYTALHDVEVRNAIYVLAYQERALLPRAQASVADRRRDAALARLDAYLNKQLLKRMDLEMNKALEHASQLSAKHSEQLGVRSLDLIHVACALELESEVFITTDSRQSQLAKAAGLKVLIP